MPDADYPLELSVTEAKRLLDTSPGHTLILDVREPHELELARIEGSEHIPMRQIPAHVDALPRDKHLLVLCRVGGRSLQVTHFLRAQGFTAVSNIAGGINAWAAEIDPELSPY